MTWEIAGTIAGIVVLYFGGIFAVARFITKPIEKRIDDLKTEMGGVKTEVGDMKTQMGDMKTQMTDLKTQIGNVKTQMTDLKTQMTDLKTQMIKDHQNLDNHLTRVEGKIDNHIADYSIHNMS